MGGTSQAAPFAPPHKWSTDAAVKFPLTGNLLLFGKITAHALHLEGSIAEERRAVRQICKSLQIAHVVEDDLAFVNLNALEHVAMVAKDDVCTGINSCLCNRRFVHTDICGNESYALMQAYSQNIDLIAQIGDLLLHPLHILRHGEAIAGRRSANCGQLIHVMGNRVDIIATGFVRLCPGTNGASAVISQKSVLHAVFFDNSRLASLLKVHASARMSKLILLT